MEAPDIIYTDGKNTCAPAPVFSNTDGNIKYIRADLTEQSEADLEKVVEFECIGKKIKMTIQELINYYIDSECCDVADECGF